MRAVPLIVAAACAVALLGPPVTAARGPGLEAEPAPQGTRPPVALAAATEARLIAEGELLTDPLVTGRVGVNEVPDAFRALANPEAHAKIIVEPWG